MGGKNVVECVKHDRNKNYGGGLSARRLGSGTEIPEGRGRFLGMNKLAVGAGRFIGSGGRFFGAPLLAISGDPELDGCVDVIGAVDMGGTETVIEVLGSWGLGGIKGGLLGGSLESISTAFVDGKDVFVFAAFMAAISSFGVLYPSSFSVDSDAVGSRGLV